MPTSATFRLSVYLTLALACASLGYSESSFLIEAPIVAGLVVVVLAGLYWLESSVELLSIPAANRLGLVVGIANLAWAVMRILRELNDPQMPNTDWTILGLGLLGPFVMTLIPAKLARRDKHAGDYWWLQGLGLATAALAGVMADDLLAFILISLYILSAIWSLSLFSVLSAGGSIRPIPGQRSETPIAVITADHRPGYRLTPALILAGVAAAFALPLFLVTPRSTFGKLEFGKPRVEIGYAADQMVDLNQTGDLRANSQVAFEVKAESLLGESVNVPADQLWRGQIKTRYQSGRWAEGDDSRLPAVAPIPLSSDLVGRPRLWADQTTFQFSLPGGTKGRFLADPVTWSGAGPIPVAWVSRGSYRPWLWIGNGWFLGETRGGRNSSEPIRYVQAWHAESQPDIGPPVHLIDIELQGVLRPLRQNPVNRVKEYADGLVNEMVRAGKIPADYEDRISMQPRSEYHNIIARAFSQHLSTTPTLTYTTELRRVRKDIDPIEDFLFYTRAGHCERFATALALMLRSQGIPAVLVLGFKGYETTDEPGHLIVRQEHAHAWVEALIQDYRPRPWWQMWRKTRWLTLDPTPGGFAASTAGEGWMNRTSSWFRRLYQTYLMEYTPEQRAEALGSLLAFLTRWDVLGGLAALLLVGMAVRAWRRIPGPSERAATPVGRWFDRLVATLAPYGLIIEPGETPREFAGRAADRLREQEIGTDVAEVPLAWADAYYDSRFGGQTLPPDRLAALDLGLEQLRGALAARSQQIGETS